jgi:hypothetical protein
VAPQGGKPGRGTDEEWQLANQGDRDRPWLGCRLSVGLHPRPSGKGIPRPPNALKALGALECSAAMGTPTPLVAPRIRKGLAALGRVTPAWLVAFLRRSMGGVRPSLRPRGQPIGPRAGSQHSMAQIAARRDPLTSGAATHPDGGAVPDDAGRRQATRGTERPRFLSQESPDWTRSRSATS